MPGTYIIIPNWNGRAYLKECLESLRAVAYKDFKTIVVDNGSTDDSKALVKLEYPDLILIELDDNYGFAAACNRGLEYAFGHGAEQGVLLNNDTVVDPDFLEKIINTAKKNESTGIVGCKIVYYDDPAMIWFAGGRHVGWRASGQHIAWMEKDIGFNGEMDCDFITGCVLLIKKSVFNKVGPFYEPYFLGVEDLDLCYFARRAGYGIKVNLEAVVKHKVSFSRSGEYSFSNGYYGTRNRLFFAFRRSRNFLGGLVILLLVVPWRLLEWTIKRQTAMRDGLLLGVLDFFRSKQGKK